MKKIFLYIAAGVFIIAAGLYLLSLRTIPSTITYGVSFSKLHADELHLNWKEVYDAILDDLGVKHLRLSAHWPMIEPTRGEFHFDELDYQMQHAAEHGADVVLAVGRRLPGWPECHDPDWILNSSKEERQARIITYITEVVNHYKNAPALRYWQVENEAFLNFADQYCDPVDEDFLSREIALVRSLDPTHPILVTDSGEFGKWYKAYSHGDIFGTSVYLYIWHHIFGPLRYPIAPGFFRFKENLLDIFMGTKPKILIELGSEPWLTKPIADASIDEQLARMDINKFNEVIAFAQKTGFQEQYLWGAEWWYYMKGNGHPEFWQRAQTLYAPGALH